MAILRPRNIYTAWLLGNMETSVPFQKKIPQSISLWFILVSPVQEVFLDLLDSQTQPIQHSRQ